MYRWRLRPARRPSARAFCCRPRAGWCCWTGLNCPMTPEVRVARISGRSVTRAQAIHPSSVQLSPFRSGHALVCVEADAICCRSSLYVHVRRRVANRRPRQTSLHHRGREISVIDEATRDRILVSPVPIDLLTAHGAVCDEPPESLLRNPSGSPCAVIAGLCQLWCVDPEQSYPLVAELQQIAACDLRDLLGSGREPDEENPEGGEEAHVRGAPCRVSGGVSGFSSNCLGNPGAADRGCSISRCVRWHILRRGWLPVV